MRLLRLVATAGILLGLSVTGTPLFDNGEKTFKESGTSARRRVPPTHVRHEWHDAEQTNGWTRRHRAAGNASLPMRIGLKQSNVQKGHDILMNISMPRSPHYGKHLTLDEIDTLFAPSEESVKSVQSWLNSEGIEPGRITRSVNKQWIQFTTTTEEAEKLLYTRYYMYQHKDTELHNIACPEYHVPARLQQHIDYITPGIKLISYGFDERKAKRARRKERRQKQEVNSDLMGLRPVELLTGACDTLVTPICIRRQYQLPHISHIRGYPGNELGIFQSLGQHYFQGDLDEYFEQLAPYVPNGTHPELRAINGAYGSADLSNLEAIGEEADLDFEVAIPLIWPQRTVLFQTDDEWYEQDLMKSSTVYNGFFNTLFDAIDGSYCTFSAYGHDGNCEMPACRDPEYPNPNAPDGFQGEMMCGAYEPTNVIAISYSGVERVLPYAYMQRQCIEILKLGLRGITVVESSGDNGVGGTHFDRRAGCLGPDHAVFNPRTMSNCPYVLSVGATVMQNDTRRPGRFEEVATTYFPSGGGFSNVFDQPPWQEVVVPEYLRAANLGFSGYNGSGWSNYSRVGLEPGLLFNKAGRGYPDVAAVGDNVVVMYRGFMDKVGGTSVAVPIWGAILTLINEERLSANKTTVGFINPVLYDHPEAFTDITVGRNPGCGTDGFHARKGWDPVTGLGTPIYPKLLDVFMELP